MIHVYTGSGKGKTTAALGLALRAAGHGRHTYMCQFLKGQQYGELAGARLLGADAAGRPYLTMAQFGRPVFIRAGQTTPEDVRLAQAGLDAARRAIASQEYEVVVLDEINVALYFELLAVDDVLALIDACPPQVELVLTGQRVPDAILARADYITEMRAVRHPYEQQGIQAREGVEY